jgi:beta-galactosidase/beta-glucuronidase
MEATDMYSYMYRRWTHWFLELQLEISADGTYTEPVILCEYAHAIGNGPGRLEASVFPGHSDAQGGFI